MRNIALIGFMGSGKSTLAGLLAKRLHYSVSELDDNIVDATEYSSVNEIFDKAGEAHFRKLELDAITKVVKEANQVISCGGGVVSSHEAMEILKKNAIVIFLHADFEAISKRLIDTNSRPLFRDREKAMTLYAQRLPLYKKYADVEIETDDNTPEEIVETIIAELVKFGIQKTCLVIGDPVSHSLSPAMHNAAYKALGIEGQYIFKSQQVAPNDLGKFIKQVRADKIQMLAVTIPHKETIMQYLDKVDPTAKEIGAVNTVINNNGILVGYNTDCLGAMNALKKHTSLAGKNVLVLGSGGTAKAIVYGLTNEKAHVVVCGRNAGKAIELASKYKCKTLLWEERDKTSDFDMIINTTPVGREGETSPITGESIQANQIVFDVNYNAKGTSLLKAARQKNAIAIDGFELLLQQGALQFELYTGLKAPIEAMRDALQNSKIYAKA